MNRPGVVAAAVKRRMAGQSDQSAAPSQAQLRGSTSVLFINRVYPPGDGATGQLLSELAPELARLGHRVTVVTSQSNAGSPSSETVNGVRVERVSAWRLTRASHWKRALGYLTVYPALLWRVLRLPRADIVVTMTDPPLLVLLGPMVKWIKNCRLVHWAQDIYPEVAEELGVLPKGGCLARLCTRLSTWACRKSDSIIVVGRCMKERMLMRGLPEDFIHVVPNWTQHAQPIEHSANPFRREHNLDGKWVVMYSGNLGLAHRFEAILDAAARLHSTHPEILFLFVGDGPRLAEVKRQVEALPPGNVRFLPPQPREMLAQSLGAADLHLASMLEHLCGLVVPSKVYGILAAGRPCVFLGPGTCEAARVIEEFRCGNVIPSRDGEALARCVVEWRNDGDRLRDAGQCAEQAARSFSLDSAAAAFHEILLQHPACVSRLEEPEEALSVER